KKLMLLPFFLAGVVAALPASAQNTSDWVIEFEITPFALHTSASDSLRPHRALKTANGQTVLANIAALKQPILERIDAALNRRLHVSQDFSIALAGVVAELAPKEVPLVAQLPGVRRVTPNRLMPLPAGSTVGSPAMRNPGDRGGEPVDPVVELSGAASIWDGSASGGTSFFGEGMIVGVTGTGINAGHPAFAGIGDDGYGHVNPFGDGVYRGECFMTPDLLCNSKLIGRYDFDESPDTTSQDTNGYSTAVASVAVGNRLLGDTVSSLGLDLVTGVAPHANLIAYRTCADIGCSTVASILAFEQAILDGVDVLVHVVSSPASSPWQDPLATAALSMHAAGISFLYTTGNSGPMPGTIFLSLAAPWNMVVASSTHGRETGARVLTGFSGGATPVPGNMLGGAQTGVYSGAIVYAGNFDNPNAPGSDPAQCLQPFPAGIFDGEILVCDRGEISRLQKSINASDSGAGGFVLANVVGGSDFIATDIYALPGIHINAADAQSLRDWLSTGTGHEASIRLANNAFNPAIADVLSSGSSRGPFPGLDYLVPSATMPALGIVTANLPDQPFLLRNMRGSATGAGAVALLKAVHPDWSPSELMSALMTTGSTPLREEDLATLTGPFDHGGGRIDLAAAAQAGLLLHVSVDEFANASPSLGGDPKALNLAGLVDLDCVGSCEWIRTVRATRAGTWTASAVFSEPLVEAQVEPAVFSLDVDERQELRITLHGHPSLADVNYTGEIILTPAQPEIPVSKLGVVATVFADSDGDGIANVADTCLNIANADQRDTNADGFGNLCDPDLDDNGIVNMPDVVQFLKRFMSSDPDADLNGDGTVDYGDIELLKTFWLQAPGPSGTVP
ncbi:MAG: S8 family serine peptidase, partial [Gammaproteobacteria bacterium]|nr:S8 family serine peptidase [Gammaproteobacteria bacterium]